MNEQVKRIEDKSTAVEVDVTIMEPSIHTEEKIRVEEFKITGDGLVAKVKELCSIKGTFVPSLLRMNRDGSW